MNFSAKLGLIVLALPAALLANEQNYSAKDEALYLKRYEAQLAAAKIGGGLLRYDNAYLPNLLIRGLSGPLPEAQPR